MKIKRSGQLRSITLDILPYVNADAGLMALTFHRDTPNGIVPFSYNGRTYKQMRCYQKVAAKYGLSVLKKRIFASITIEVNDVTEHELERLLANINQAYAMHEYGAKVTDIYRNSAY